MLQLIITELRNLQMPEFEQTRTIKQQNIQYTVQHTNQQLHAI